MDLFEINEEVNINGVVEEVVFHNSDNGFTVITLNADGEFITAVGALPELTAGEEMTLSGIWDEHNMFGRQLKIASFTRKLPDNTSGLLKYLSSGTIKGLGPKTALKIIEQFGENAFNVLENEPERLKVIKGITREKATEISNEYNKQVSIRKVMITLEAYGISPTECIAVFKRFGSAAANVIEENPYILCQSINSVTFERAEIIAKNLNLAPDYNHRIRAGIMHVIKHNALNGHTCLPREKLIPPCCDLLGVGEDDVDIAIDSLCEDKMLVMEKIDTREFIFLCDTYICEKNIASRLQSLLQFPPRGVSTLEGDIDALEKKDKILYERMQREAIKTAALKGMLILTGGPGTGKTTTVKGIINLFEQQNLEIVLCAPTGRAAKRMSEVTGREAKTIHRLLEVDWNDNEKPIFRRDLQNPLGADAVIVDEMSMVDVFLFSSLLDAIKFGCKLILVGDNDQLPPVGVGNVLSDLIKSDKIPIVCLSEIFRQARESLIVMNAHSIIEGKDIDFETKSSDFFFMERTNAVAAGRTVVELCTKRLVAAYGYSPTADIQILCPSRKGDCGTMNLNRELQAALNPPAKNKGEFKVNGRIFRKGDKVMQTKNNYDILWKKGKEQGLGVFNGDIGIITELSAENRTLVIDFDERVCDYPVENIYELEHAYAVTVHKSQGSEFEAVVMPVIDAPQQLMYRNLLYTAVTRAKKILILVGNRSRIQSMIQNNKKSLRYSALCHFLTSE